MDKIDHLHHLFLSFIGLLSLALSACGGAGSASAGCSSLADGSKIEVVEAWARAAAGQASAPTSEMQMGASSTSAAPLSSGLSTSAIYFTLRNCGRQADRLVAVTSGAAQFVEMNNSHTNNGVTIMTLVSGVDVPSGGQVEFKPGALHVMLTRLNGDLVAGSQLPFTLEFEKAGKITAAAQIRSP